MNPVAGLLPLLLLTPDLALAFFDLDLVTFAADLDAVFASHAANVVVAGAAGDDGDLASQHETFSLLASKVDTLSVGVEASSSGNLTRLLEGVAPNALLIYGEDDGGCSGLEDLQPLLSRVPVIVPTNCDLSRVNLRLDSLVFQYRRRGSSSPSEEIILSEVYAVKAGPRISRDVAAWSRANGTVYVASTNVWERRKDLRGAALTNLHLPYAPLVFYSEPLGRYTGTFNDLALMLADSLNFTLDFREPEDGAWGGKDENG